MIARCAACGTAYGGGKPALASARWRFHYRNGRAVEACVCAGCGFERLARRAVRTATLNDGSELHSVVTATRQRVSAEVLALRGQLREIAARMGALSGNAQG